MNEKLIREFEARKLFFNKASSKGYKVIAGIDEVGRGPLAGPVCAACVVLDYSKPIYGLKDSKKCTDKQKQKLFDEIINKSLYYSYSFVDNKTIDEINILEATKIAMINSISKLKVRPDYLLIDAINLNIDIQQESLIKGDNLSNEIAAASILAKVIRDKVMIAYSRIYPEYAFHKNKGYGTKEHIDAIKRCGLTPIHRLSFTKKFHNVKL